MWEELTGITAWWEVLWCVGGDFNTVWYPTKRVGSEGISPSMTKFSNFIFSLGAVGFSYGRWHLHLV